MLQSPLRQAAVDHWRTAVNAVMVLDQLGQAVMLCDANGRLELASPSLLDMVADDPEGSLVLLAMQRLAVSVAPRASGQNRMRASKSIRTASCRYDALSCAWGQGDHAAMMIVSLTRRATSCARRLDAKPAERLTPREHRIALLLAEGRRNGDVAQHLGISKHTVKRHVEQVFRKLQVNSRAAVARALDALEDVA